MVVGVEGVETSSGMGVGFGEEKIVGWVSNVARVEGEVNGVPERAVMIGLEDDTDVEKTA